MHMTKFRCDCGHEFWTRTVMADDWLRCPSCQDEQPASEYVAIDSMWQRSDGHLYRRPEQGL